MHADRASPLDSFASKNLGQIESKLYNLFIDCGFNIFSSLDIWLLSAGTMNEYEAVVLATSRYPPLFEYEDSCQWDKGQAAAQVRHVQLLTFCGSAICDYGKYLYYFNKPKIRVWHFTFSLPFFSAFLFIAFAPFFYEFCRLQCDGWGICWSPFDEGHCWRWLWLRLVLVELCFKAWT